jgi:hypothetical protein
MSREEYSYDVPTDPLGLYPKGVHSSPDEVLPHYVKNFTDISTSEKLGLVSSLKFMVEHKFSHVALQKARSLYRETEGKAFRGYLQRLQSLATAEKFELKGVHAPLDVEVKASSKTIKIYLPEDLDAHADNGIIHDAMRYAASMEGVTTDRTPGKLISGEKEGNFFVMGYITEILSDQRIERITYAKHSPYQAGRMCARMKILLSVLDQHKVPAKYLKVPERYLGGTMKFKEPEIVRALQMYFRAEEIPHLRLFLEALLEHSIRVNREGVLRKIGVSVFLPTSEILHVFKKKTRKTLQTQRKGKSITVTESLDPTKPSQLATVAPWEREAVTELYEEPWADLKKLVDSFELKGAADRDYNEFGKEVSRLIDKQWEAKQRILRATKHRIEIFSLDKKETQLFKKLNAVREALTTIGVLDACRKDVLPDMDPWQLLPSRILRRGSEPELPEVLFRDLRMASLFPHVNRLLSTWETIKPVPSGPKGPEAKG